MRKGNNHNPYGRPKKTIGQTLMTIMDRREVAPSGCWEWTGPLNQWGYGQVSFRGRHTMAHRFMAFVNDMIGWDDARLVLHRCDNPKCFNPEHLFTGTARDNARDCTMKMRQHQQQKSHCPRGHEYSSENTRLKLSAGSFGPERVCKTCHREREAARRRALCVSGQR